MVLVINKIDSASSFRTELRDQDGYTFDKYVYTCALTGQGIEELENSIVEIVGLNTIPAGGSRWTVNQVSCLNVFSSSFYVHQHPTLYSFPFFFFSFFFCWAMFFPL